MKILAGTSGYSYKAWKGDFYPPKLAEREMLTFYARQLPAVEINSTFYRLPATGTFESWAARVPDHFRFAIKAPRRITHIKRLNAVEQDTESLLAATQTLGAKLGALLFQLPPFFQKDAKRLNAFLKLLPRDAPAAFEFRHPSWLTEEIFASLRARNAALCVSDTDEKPAEQMTSTSDWSYMRLRRADYADADLNTWLTRLHQLEDNKAFVFFKHEDSGTGPRFAKRLLELSAQKGCQ